MPGDVKYIMAVPVLKIAGIFIYWRLGRRAGRERVIPPENQERPLAPPQRKKGTYRYREATPAAVMEKIMGISPRIMITRAAMRGISWGFMGTSIRRMFTRNEKE